MIPSRYSSRLKWAAMSLVCFTSLTDIPAVDEVTSQEQTAAPTYPGVDDALVIFRRGNPDGALRLLQDAKAKHPELPPAEVMMARFWFAHNQPEQGKNSLQQAVVSSPEDPEAYLLLAEISAANNDLAQADTLFERGFEKCERLEKEGPRFRVLTGLSLSGRAAMSERRQLWDAAEKHLRAFLAIEPNNAVTVDRLARVLFFRQEHEASREMFARLVELNSGVRPPEVQLGLLFEQTNQRESAAKEMKAASERHANDLETRVAVANWALYIGDVDLADENISAALNLDSQSVSARLLQGIALLFRGQPQEAEPILRAAHNDAPGNFDAIQQLALSLIDQDDPIKHRLAIEYADLNRRANSDLRTDAGRTAAGTYAWTLFRTNNVSAARQVISSVLQAGQFSPQISYYAAEIFAASGDTDLAGKLAQASIDSTRTFPERGRAEQLRIRLRGGATEPTPPKANSAK